MLVWLFWSTKHVTLTQTQREHRQITAISCVPYHILFFLLKIWGSDCDRFSQSSPSCMQQNKLYKGRCSWYINRQRMQSGTQHFFFYTVYGQWHGFMAQESNHWWYRLQVGTIKSPVDINRCLFTILPRINTQLVDARWRLSQNVDGVAGGAHVVEEVDRQGREGEHHQPQYGQHIRHHDKLHKEGAEWALRCILIINWYTEVI